MRSLLRMPKLSDNSSSCPTRSPAPRINSALLGFDFDGVIADTAEIFLRMIREEHGLGNVEREDIVDFDVENCLSLDREAVDAVFEKILKDSVGVGLRPMPGAVKVLSALAEQAPITVITARPLAAPVLEWFADLLPRSVLSDIRLIATGTHDGKAEHVLAQGLRYFVDDRAATCEQLNAAGVQPLVFRQPWNQTCRSFPSVRSWQDISSLCCSGQSLPEEL